MAKQKFSATDSLVVLTVIGFLCATTLAFIDRDKFGTVYFGIVGNLTTAVIALSRSLRDDDKLPPN